nr:hypothetical protein [Chloroflexota bacterium]
MLLALWATGCKTYVQDLDITQERLDAATPPLDGSHMLVQSFISQHPNLCEIELLPAVYQTPGQGTLTVCLQGIGPNTTPLVRQCIDVTSIAHNVPLRLAFLPQKDSAGKAYKLVLEGSPGVRVGFWYSSVDAYGNGELLLDGQVSGDLRFSTHYRYDLAAMGHDIGKGLRQSGWLFIPFSLLLLLPGYVLWYSLGLAKPNDPIANLAMCLAISLGLIPIALLWSTVVGLRWDRISCVAALIVLALCAATRLLRTKFSDLVPWTTERNRPTALLTGVLFALTLLVRFVQIRNLIVPAWVDSPQHALITQLFVLYGQVPQSYEPLLPIKDFVYHFGFHADTALFHWLSGLAIPQAMLILGQILNAVSMLMAYLVTWRLVQRKLSAITAALIVGLVSYMPAYYVSWGRYTQLTGMLLLPAAMVTALDWLETQKRDYRLLLMAGLIQSGLFLTHVRVTVFAICFLSAFMLCESIGQLRARNKDALLELWSRAGLCILATLCISAPWLVRMITHLHVFLPDPTTLSTHVVPSSSSPYGLLFITRNRELMSLAAIGGLCGLLKRKKESIWILAWCMLVALLTYPRLVGLLAANLLNPSAAVIALFLPMAIWGGQAVACIWDSIQPILSALLRKVGAQRNTTILLRSILAVLLLGTALWNGWGIIQIINPITVLATHEDWQAMDWIEDNTPPNALFLINARHWQYGIYTGTDGGYWIAPLTGRRTLLPTLPYAYGSPDYVQRVNEMARIVAETKDVNELSFQTLLAQEKVTHIYIGAKGGPLTPKMFLGNARYRPVYNSGAVWIFEVVR